MSVADGICSDRAGVHGWYWVTALAMISVMVRMRRVVRLVVIVASMLACLAAPARTASAQTGFLMGGLTWMVGYPPTWNAMSSKVVSDGLFSYAVLCGFSGSPNICSIVKRRGNENWVQGAASFTANQPPIAILDRKGRLNIFYNDPTLRHLRFDRPTIDVVNYTSLPSPFWGTFTGYINATYDAPSDTIMLAFNETSTWQLYFTTKHADDNWTTPSALPMANPGTLNLYARTIRAGGHYFVLAGEHIIGSPNANYIAAMLYESPAAEGPWSTRELHRATGTNQGVPYENWVYTLDLQIDQSGRARAIMQIAEPGSGHTPLPEGIYIARQEDNFALRLVGNGIDDGFGLHVDPITGVHFVFALRLSDPVYTFPGRLVAFRSDDNGATWTPAQLLVADPACNPMTIETSGGSMIGGQEIPFIYSANVLPPFDRVLSNAIAFPMSNTADRYDYSSIGPDGAVDYVRAYSDPASSRSYYYVYDRRADGTFTVTYVYYAGSFYQVYVGESNGEYRYYDSTGYRFWYGRPEEIFYWYTDGNDGSQDYIYIYRDRSRDLYWWKIFDYDVTGMNWKSTYVYYYGNYWRIELEDSAGHYLRYDSTGYYATG